MSIASAVRPWLLSLLIASAGLAESLPPVSARPPAWEPYRAGSEDALGYEMFTRKPPGSDFSAYRLEAILEAPPDLVASAARRHVLDPDHRQKNMDKTILRNDDEKVLIHSYIHINVPFVSDRDVVTRVVDSYDADTRSYYLNWFATDEGPPPSRGVVRLDRSEGSWTFEPAPNGATRAIYVSHTEIAGSLPSWILNRFMSDNMVQGIAGLREALEREHDEH